MHVKVCYFQWVWEILIPNRNITKVVDLLEDGYYPNLLMIKCYGKHFKFIYSYEHS